MATATVEVPQETGQKTLVHYDVQDGVAILTLDDPPANTYTHEMMRQLDAAHARARFDAGVDVIVITGAGEKFFCAGANINMLQKADPTFKYYFCLHANETLHAPRADAQAGDRGAERPHRGRRARDRHGRRHPHRARAAPARSACPRWRWACFRAPAARSGSRAWWASRRRSR